MTTAIPPLPAATRISASKYVQLAPRTMIATTPPTAQHAIPADTLLEAWPSLHLGVSTVLRARQTMTPTRPRLANPAHPAATQRKATVATASGVPWAPSRQLLAGPARLPASLVNLVSLLPPHHRHVVSARLGELTGTPIRQRSAWTVEQARTLGVVRRSVLFVLLARLTAMRVRPRRVLHAWRVSTGRVAQR